MPTFFHFKTSIHIKCSEYKTEVLEMLAALFIYWFYSAGDMWNEKIKDKNNYVMIVGLFPMLNVSMCKQNGCHINGCNSWP